MRIFSVQDGYDVALGPYMRLSLETTHPPNGTLPERGTVASPCLGVLGLILAVLLTASPDYGEIYGQNQATDWQAQVRKYAEARDWDLAMHVVDEEMARAPQDLDVRAWRARVLAWSGHLADAEREYLEILKSSPSDPDNWMGLANVYLREGKIEQAQQAADAAVELDPKRADLHAARARVLRAAGKRNEARLEFQKALDLDPTSAEARAGLISVRGEPKHDLRFGQDNDLLNFAGDYHDEWMSLVSQWTARWATNVSGDFYQRSGATAGKFVGSVTRRQPKWGAVTVGGAIGHDNAVIPKSEAFFELDHGRKTGESNFVRGLEFTYGLHWYWYQAARILTLNGDAIVYLPQDWTFSLAATGARSAFAGTGAEWRPSGMTRLGFPLTHWEKKRLSGNIFFAAGTENFAVVDQIGRFASQTYGGGLRFQITARQYITGFGGYQKRTKNRTDASFGLSYGIHF
ncbi:MAG TPA: tetratricopeptide repeat protein [Candidatus Dormibacteraeota bacterium]|nr:tetratricopeptide repeat protein [Candidatus Dormibacteraeota bacterium]